MPKLLCPHCLQPLEDGYHGECPHCGRSLENRNPEGALPFGTQLGDKYTVGAYLSADGDGLASCVPKGSAPSGLRFCSERPQWGHSP